MKKKKLTDQEQKAKKSNLGLRINTIASEKNRERPDVTKKKRPEAGGPP